MGTLLLALTLCGQPAACEVQPACEPTTMEVNAVHFHHRHPVARLLKGIGKAVNHLRPFRHHRQDRRGER